MQTKKHQIKNQKTDCSIVRFEFRYPINISQLTSCKTKGNKKKHLTIFLFVSLEREEKKMSHHFLGFAEKAFSVDPRPAALNIERFISTLVLLDIIIQLILIGFILTDEFTCFEAEGTVSLALESSKPSHPPIDAYLEVVCGTQIRSDAFLFYGEKIVFLFFFLAIFYLNKAFIRRISRYHCIIMGEKIERYLSTVPVYENVDYKKRWNTAVIMFFIYKLITLFLLSCLITAAICFIYEVEAVSKLFNFDGVICGPQMDFVKDLGAEFICHFYHEFLIKVTSWVTTVIAFLVLIAYFISVFALLYYVYKFRNQSIRKEHLNESLIGYELVEKHVE